MRDSFRIQSFSATTSTSPVGIAGLTVSGAALLDAALHGNHVFRAKLLRLLVQRRIGLRAKYQLGHSVAVAQMNKDHAAQVAPAVHPAHQQCAFAGIRGTQLTARVCAPEIA